MEQFISYRFLLFGRGSLKYAIQVFFKEAYPKTLFVNIYGCNNTPQSYLDTMASKFPRFVQMEKRKLAVVVIISKVQKREDLQFVGQAIATYDCDIHNFLEMIYEALNLS